ncbi:SH3 domain-containing protein [Rhodovulum steppense]|uniref:SH3-like domain-containing protein n=1 Tax=Rhodovulum steppense TaxID=540251 RepID=A0A4V2R4R5_9RHOB|nr:SH3-like domain-containing protein [Rhodovulum steppense]
MAQRAIGRIAGSALVLLVCMMALAAPVQAAERGPVTNLPLPRYVSLKAGESNVRRGPSLSHRVDWVYKRRGMPLQITAEYGHWRRVQDRDGAGGWMHYSLLSGVRTVLVDEDMVPMRRTPQTDAPVLAQAERGVIARLGACRPDWCRISAEGRSGWVPKGTLWGVETDEIRD